MKKALLATSAIIGAGFFASSASAADFSISGGVSMSVVYNKFLTAPSGIDTDGEVDVNFGINDLVFKASAATDTGLEYGVKYELSIVNADGGNVTTDEAVAYLSGDWGKLELGFEDGAENGSISGNINDSPEIGTIGIYGDSSDAGKVSYYSPSFSGVTLGVSYAPDKVNGTESDFDHWIGVKLGYSGAASDDIGYDVALVYGINMTTGDGDATGNPMGIGFGASVDAYGATVALSVVYNIGYEADNKDPLNSLVNQLGVAVGVVYNYGQGNVGAGFEYHMDMNVLDAVTGTTDASRSESGWTVGVGADYNIAAGVIVDVDFTYGSNTTVAKAFGVKDVEAELSGIYLKVGTEISF